MNTDPNSFGTRNEDEESALLETEALRRELSTDEEYCYAYAESFMNTWVASQIRVLREQRGMTQEQLGQAIGTKQTGISRLENINYSSWKTDTLRRLARALHVRLDIRFRPFGTLLDDTEVLGSRVLKVVPRENDPRLLYPRRKGPGSDISPGEMDTRNLQAATIEETKTVETERLERYA